MTGKNEEKERKYFGGKGKPQTRKKSRNNCKITTVVPL